MFGASLYIIRCTARNRLRVRLKRLREPRYLIGAIVGATYLYFSIFARFGAQRARASRRRNRSAMATPASLAVLSASGPAFTGLALMVLTAVAWILPFDSGLLEFSNAEIQFLFPAPVSRRSLLVHRLMRSQLGMLFGSIIVGLVMPSASGYMRLRTGIGMWLLLCIGKVYFTGISLARTRLGSHDAKARRVAWLPLGVMTAALAVVGTALWRSLTARPIDGAGDLLNRVGEVSTTGAPQWVLWPFVAIARPIFAAWPGPFLLSLVGAGVVLAASVAWVLASDGTFQDAAEEIAVRKAGEPAKAATSYRAGAAAWRLAPAGRSEMVFAWKAATQTLRVVDRRTLFRIVMIVGVFAILAVSIGQGRGLAAAIALFSLAAVVFSVMLAPQAIRIDMRQDLEHLELLKTWPLHASAVVRGQLLWPGVLISALSWVAIVSAVIFLPAIVPRIGLTTRLGIGGAALLVAPALVFAQLAIHNGAALIFPAWIPLGTQRARGLDAMGQRIIMLGGTWIALILLTVPGAIAGTIVWFAFASFVGPLAFVPAALVCAVALFAEVLAMTEMLGPAYDRLDLLAVERSE